MKIEFRDGKDIKYDIIIRQEFTYYFYIDDFCSFYNISEENLRRNGLVYNEEELELFALHAMRIQLDKDFHAMNYEELIRVTKIVIDFIIEELKDLGISIH